MSAAILDYHRLASPEPAALPRKLDALNHALHGRHARRAAVGAGFLREAEAAGAPSLAQEFAGCGTAELKRAAEELRGEFRRGRGHESATLRIRALALLREAAERTCGLRPFPVQLAGALALYRGHLAEMATGEGKTLVAALAAVLAGWGGTRCT